jgi:hypothetical protein
VSPDVLLCATRTDGFYYLHRKGVGPPEITPVPHLNSKSVPGNVADVFKDDDNYYWISSYPGLSVFDPVSGNIRRVIQKTPSLHGIPWKDKGRLFCGMGIFEVNGNMKDGFVLKKNEILPDTLTGSMIWKIPGISFGQGKDCKA